MHAPHSNTLHTNYPHCAITQQWAKYRLWRRGAGYKSKWNRQRLRRHHCKVKAMMSLFLVRISFHSFLLFLALLIIFPFLVAVSVSKICCWHWHCLNKQQSLHHVTTFTFESTFTFTFLYTSFQIGLLVAGSLSSPVSEPAAEPSPEAQPVADPEADAHYGHYGHFLWPLWWLFLASGRGQQ